MAPTVLAECRPNLRACYFFIKNIPNAGGASVEVGEQTISIQGINDPVFIVLPPLLNLVPGSISCDKMTCNDTFTFRTSIQGFRHTTCLNEGPSEFLPIVDVNEAVSIHCNFCHENLTDARAFSRVLPLPSCDEPTDFFCHGHSDAPLSLEPKPADFFYNYFFYKIHVDNFKVPVSCSRLQCPNCLEILGEVRGESVKLWIAAVSLSAAGVSEAGDSIEKFIKSFAYFVKNLPAQMNKFVLTASHGSSKHYTLIWIMDRTLLILENPEGSDCSSCVELEMHLAPKKVMKVLYSHHEMLTAVAEEWMKSFNSSLIPIHPRIEAQLVNYLKARAAVIPADCRTVDGMSVSYMDT